MAQILNELQSKYVPTDSNNGTNGEILQRVIFDGDQLTEERGRNCQWANTLAEYEMDRLDGIMPAFADWHLKKMLLGVKKTISIIYALYHPYLLTKNINIDINLFFFHTNYFSIGPCYLQNNSIFFS